MTLLVMRPRGTWCMTSDQWMRERVEDREDTGHALVHKCCYPWSGNASLPRPSSVRAVYERVRATRAAGGEPGAEATQRGSPSLHGARAHQIALKRDYPLGRQQLGILRGPGGRPMGISSAILQIGCSRLTTG